MHTPEPRTAADLAARPCGRGPLPPHEHPKPCWREDTPPPWSSRDGRVPGDGTRVGARATDLAGVYARDRGRSHRSWNAASAWRRKTRYSLSLTTLLERQLAGSTAWKKNTLPAELDGGLTTTVAMP